MANAFSKEERVAFEDLLEGFHDALVLSRNVGIYNTDQTMMAVPTTSSGVRCLTSLSRSRPLLAPPSAAIRT